MSSKTNKFTELLDRQVSNTEELRQLLWSGVPSDAPFEVRGTSWKILLGLIPIQKERRDSVLDRRKNEYKMLAEGFFPPSSESDETCNEHFNGSVRRGSDIMQMNSTTDEKTLRQINVDIPRTSPTGFKIFCSPSIQALMARILYCWAIRHPASGYVQGINDLLAPLIVVFLRAATGSELSEVSINAVSANVLSSIEAEAYWSLTKILGYIQDNYTFGQPGAQRLISKLKDVVRRIDKPLYNHLAAEGVDFLQFSFRWINCLLIRELPISGIIRLWDTYIAEGAEGFSTFHLYICAAFLVVWSSDLQKMDFQQIMLFLQKLPTQNWTDREIEVIISEAYVLKALFHSAPKHLSSE